MLKPTIFAPIRPRTALALLLVILSASSGVLLYRAYRGSQENAAKAVSDQLKDQIAQTLRKNAEDLKFIENKGQWSADVLYALESATGAVWIRKDDILFRAVHKKSDDGAANQGPTTSPAEPQDEAHTWRMKLAGMNPDFTVREGANQETLYSYFTDKDNMLPAVRSFKEITLEAVYPGIDLRFYSGERMQIEYDFIVAPGSDYKQIKMDYEGQDSLTVAEDKSLELGLRFATIRTQLPEVYQVKDGDKIPVEVAFKVEGNRAEFEAAGPIDPALPLVIDPTLLWGTYADNSSTGFDAYAYASKANICGEVYVGGWWNQALSSGTLQVETATVSGSPNADGTLSVVVAAAADGFPYTVLVPVNNVDTAANVATKIRNQMILHSTITTNFTVTVSGAAVILTRVAPARANDATLSVAFNPASSLGISLSSANTTAGVPSYSAPGYDNSFSADRQAVLYRFNATGTTLLNLTFLGGGLTTGDVQHANAFIDLDIFPDGRVIAVGRTQGTTLPVTGNAYQPLKVTVGATEPQVTGMIAVFDSTLTTLHYATYLGGATLSNTTNTNVVRTVVVLDDTTYFVGGVMTGGAVTAGFATGGADTASTGSEGYVARFSNYGTWDWGTYVGGDNTDDVYSLALTPENPPLKVVFAGHTIIAPTTTAAEDLTAVETGFDVGSTAGFVSPGVLQIEGEQIPYTILDGNTFTLTRNPGAVTHPDGALVQPVVTTNPGFPTLVNPVDSALSGTEVFVGYFNVGSASSFQLLSYVGGSSVDTRPVVTADTNDLFVVGTTSWGDFPGTEVNSATAGLTDIFVSKIPFTGLAGNLLTRYLGSGGNDSAGSVVITALDEVLVFGTASNTAPAYPTRNTVPATTFFDGTHNGALDIVWTYLNKSLSGPSGPDFTLFSTFIGSPNENDYLGDTGVLAGSGHIGINRMTGVITLATTVHGVQNTTIIPASGVFDPTKSNGDDDTHMVLKFTAEVSDYGDAPASNGGGSYDDGGANAARHAVQGSNPRFGLIVDVDSGGLSSNFAVLDDITVTSGCGAGGDDEDGDVGPGSIPSAIACTTGAAPSTLNISINSFNSTGSTANIYAWIDADADGLFENTENLTTTLASTGVQTGVPLSFTGLPALPPLNSANGLRGYFLRFRITTVVLTDTDAGTLDTRSRGSAIDGEVEDHFIRFENFDYGDANISPGTSGVGAAVHLIRDGLFIGATSPATDRECDGQPNATATGDNINGVNDEQAFASLSFASTVPSLTIPIPVTNLTGSAAKLCGWIDFNRNGVFDNGGSPNDEGVCVTVPNGTNNTTVNLTWSPLSGSLPTTGNPVYLRLRLSTDPSLTDATPTGALAGLGDGEVEDHLVTISDTTAIALASFNAYKLGESVFLDWKTGFEADNLGFNVYREAGGRRYPVTPSLVAGSALMVAQGTRLEAGLSYAWRDDVAGDTSGVQYWLEEVDLNGATTTHGPFSVTSGESLSLAKRRFLASQPRAMRLSEIADRLGSLGTSHDAEPHAELQFSTDKTAPVTAKASQSAGRSPVRSRGADLSGLHGVKIEVKRAGWYRVPQDVLVAAGLNGDPRSFQLYADGKQVPIRVTGEEDGKFDVGDAVEFYGVGLDIPSTDTRVYWLMASRLRGQRMPSSGAGGGGSPPPSFTHTVERKDRLVYVSAVLNGEAENFFGIPLAVSIPSVTEALSTPNLYTEGDGAATLEVALQGVSQHQHSIKVTLNGVVLGSVNFAGQQRGVKSFPVAQSQLVAGDNLVKLDRESAAADVTLVDSLRLTYQHAWKADANAVIASAQGGQQVTIGGFTSANVRIIDITDTDSPVELTAEVTGGQGSFTVSAAVASPGERKLYAFSNDVVKTAADVEANQPSAWKRAENRADFIIISHSSLMAGVAPLVELRRSQGWRVQLVGVDDIYDEFSYGHKTPEAISDFIRFAATSWKVKPKAVLFVGKATYDPRYYTGQGDLDLVPTGLVETKTMESAVDDSLADFNADGIPELAVGRLPVRNAAEALALVAKIVAYEVSVPSNRVALISDIGDSFSFDGVSAQLKGVLPAGVEVQEISRGTLGDSQARARVLEELDRAHRIINYVGHGSIELWRGGLLTVDDAASLQKGNELSLFIMMTCLNGYFISPSTESLSESLLRSSGGAVATWSSSGTTTPEGQAAMNVAAFQHLFGGQNMTIGEAARAAKAAIGEPDIRRTWNLLGDPTMRLR